RELVLLHKQLINKRNNAVRSYFQSLFIRDIFCVSLFVLIFSGSIYADDQASWIRINQLGYLNNSIKNAVYVSFDETADVTSFEVINSATNKSEFKSDKVEAYGAYGAFQKTFRLDFSDLKKEGSYFIQAGEIKSPVFKIGNNVYDGTADFILQYM